MYRALAVIVYFLFFLSPKNEILVNETFSYPDGPLPAHYWSEGCQVFIRNERLFIDADITGPRASSVWLNKELMGNTSIEFDVHIVSSSDDANNINVFLMYSDPSRKQLSKSSEQRKDGLYRRYHELKGYIFTNVTNGDSSNIRYRFRKNPGFKLVSEAHAVRKSRKQQVHIKILKMENHFEYWEDDQKVFDVTDSGIAGQYNKGLFGFRTWHTAMEIDNLLIKKI